MLKFIGNYENKVVMTMIDSNIETMRAGKVLPDHCRCGHLKDHHLPVHEGMDFNLQCQDYVFDTKANKMLQCGCKI